jgi:hypothetical protein
MEEVFLTRVAFPELVSANARLLGRQMADEVDSDAHFYNF